MSVVDMVIVFCLCVWLFVLSVPVQVIAWKDSSLKCVERHVKCTLHYSLLTGTVSVASKDMQPRQTVL